MDTRTEWNLQDSLDRSAQLLALVEAAWNIELDSDQSRRVAAHGLCLVSIQHSAGLQVLLPGVPGSALTLLRSQFECLVRAVWALHSASDSDLARLLAPLTLQSQQSAKKLPGIADMVAALAKTGPRGAAALLARARARLGDGLNSFVHGGIHPFARARSGYPAGLLVDVLKNSNAFAILTLIVLAEIRADQEMATLPAALHAAFEDVLPTLEPLEV